MDHDTLIILCVITLIRYYYMTKNKIKLIHLRVLCSKVVISQSHIKIEQTT